MYEEMKTKCEESAAELREMAKDLNVNDPNELKLKHQSQKAAKELERVASIIDTFFLK